MKFSPFLSQHIKKLMRLRLPKITEVISYKSGFGINQGRTSFPLNNDTTLNQFVQYKIISRLELF